MKKKKLRQLTLNGNRFKKESSIKWKIYNQCGDKIKIKNIFMIYKCLKSKIRKSKN